VAAALFVISMAADVVYMGGAVLDWPCKTTPEKNFCILAVVLQWLE